MYIISYSSSLPSGKVLYGPSWYIGHMATYNTGLIYKPSTKASGPSYNRGLLNRPYRPTFIYKNIYNNRYKKLIHKYISIKKSNEKKVYIILYI